MFKIVERTTGQVMECTTSQDKGAYILNTFVEWYDMSKFMVLQTENGTTREVKLRRTK